MSPSTPREFVAAFAELPPLERERVAALLVAEVPLPTLLRELGLRSSEGSMDERADIADFMHELLDDAPARAPCPHCAESGPLADDFE